MWEFSWNGALIAYGLGLLTAIIGIFSKPVLEFGFVVCVVVSIVATIWGS